MEISKLAKELKQRLISMRLVPEYNIGLISDYDIIESYITCSRCGRMSISKEQLLKVVEKVNSAEEFLNETEKYSCN